MAAQRAQGLGLTNHFHEPLLHEPLPTNHSQESILPRASRPASAEAEGRCAGALAGCELANAELISLGDSLQCAASPPLLENQSPTSPRMDNSRLNPGSIPLNVTKRKFLDRGFAAVYLLLLLVVFGFTCFGAAKADFPAIMSSAQSNCGMFPPPSPPLPNLLCELSLVPQGARCGALGVDASHPRWPRPSPPGRPRGCCS